MGVRYGSWHSRYDIADYVWFLGVSIPTVISYQLPDHAVKLNLGDFLQHALVNVCGLSLLVNVGDFMHIHFHRLFDT